MYNDNCNKIEGVTYIVMFYYGPLMCFVLFNVISSLFMALRYFSNPKYRSRKFYFVVILPLTYGILAVADAASFDQANRSNSKKWWIMQVMVNNLRIIIPSTLVMVAFCRQSIKKIMGKHKRENSELLRK